MTRAQLSAVITRDGVPFAEDAIPDVVLDRLADNRVVVLGETHHLREHWDFTAGLLQELHAHGFRQLLVEQPQMADWLLDDYVSGGLLEPDLVPPAHWRQTFVAIREFNAALPLMDRIHVRAIDVNEEFYGGANAFRSLLEAVAGHLPTAGPVDVFLQEDYGIPENQPGAIENLRASLETDRTALVASWGSDWYETVLAMVDVERASIDIRAHRKTDDSTAARAREDVIKHLADARIASYAHGTVINIGGHHAQKTHLMGTEQEWLGDYLVHRSTAIDGTVMVVGFASARTDLLAGAGGTPFDVLDTSPENELFRVMVETWPGRTVFLPLDDPVFADRGVAVNSEETIYVTPLKEQYDAVIQYGLAHRMPEG